MNKIFYENKSFSIESGSFEGKKRIPASGGILKAGAIAGSIIGLLTHMADKFNLANTLFAASIGALIRWMYNLLDKADYNTPIKGTSILNVINYVRDVIDQPETSVSTSRSDSDTSTTVTTTRTRSERSSEGVIWGVNQNQKDFDLSIAYDGYTMLMLVNDISKGKMRFMNSLLDEYCKNYKNAYYQSKSIGKNSYLVAVTLVGQVAGPLMVEVINAGVSVNFLTTEKSLRY